MYVISKSIEVSSSHRLCGLPTGHPCAFVHGHNYRVELRFSSDSLTEPGFVKDYRDLVVIFDLIKSEMDHRHLNDVYTFNPTVENLARYWYEKIKQIEPLLCGVVVSETTNTWCEYHE